jgi:hypothetical protein
MLTKRQNMIEAMNGASLTASLIAMRLFSWLTRLL